MPKSLISSNLDRATHAKNSKFIHEKKTETRRIHEEKDFHEKNFNIIKLFSHFAGVFRAVNTFAIESKKINIEKK